MFKQSAFIAVTAAFSLVCGVATYFGAKSILPKTQVIFYPLYYDGNPMTYAGFFEFKNENKTSYGYGRLRDISSENHYTNYSFDYRAHEVPLSEKTTRVLVHLQKEPNWIGVAKNDELIKNGPPTTGLPKFPAMRFDYSDAMFVDEPIGNNYFGIASITLAGPLQTDPQLSFAGIDMNITPLSPIPRAVKNIETSYAQQIVHPPALGIAAFTIPIIIACAIVRNRQA